jgi:Rod binding domain-containing protein
VKAVINNEESNMNYQNIASKIVDDKKRLGLSETIAKQLQRLANNNSLTALDKMQAEITVDWYYPLYK